MLSVWQDFDGWCVVKGIDPLELSSRRFINLALWFMREGLDEEARKKLQVELDKAAYVPHPFWKVFWALGPMSTVKLRPRPANQPAEKPTNKITGWTKPEGWTPPGWKSDAENYRNAMRVASNLGRK